jgi:hypothetical protein
LGLQASAPNTEGNLTKLLTSQPVARQETFCHNNTQTPPGNFTIIFNGTLTCSQSGHVVNGTIIGKIENINLYQAVCTFENQTLKCDIKAQ